MRISEITNSNQTIRVFHGSPEKNLRLLPQYLYGVRDFGFAASYAVERGRGSGFVYTLDFSFHKLGDDKIIDKVCEDNEIENFWGISIVEQYPETIKLFQDLGYDGLTSYDFGFRSDFEQLQSWVVFNAAKQVKIIGITEVGPDDLKHTHAP